MHIAIYWDFENIHASLCTVKNGPSWYRENRFSKQPALVDINSLMEYISGLGDVNINKAFANWSNLSPYSFELQNHSIDLIQMFPRGKHGKNGADIRMAIEVIEDITVNPHISIIIIIGGDSDYISIAQKVRQRGKSIIGIGVKETTNQYWVKSCNEFKYYSSLLVKSSSIQNIEAEGYEEFDIEDAKELLCKAMLQIVDQSGENLIKKAMVKPMMMRLDPSFDESNYGFKSFGDFLENCNDTVKITHGEYDHMLSLVDAVKASCKAPKTNSIHPYEKILKKQQVRLLDAKVMNTGVIETWNLFAEQGELKSYAEFKDELGKRLHKKSIKTSESDLSKIKALLYKTFAFKISPEDKRIGLNPYFTSSDNLLVKVHWTLFKRIMDNIDEDPDIVEISNIPYGDRNKVNMVKKLVEHYKNSNQKT